MTVIALGHNVQEATRTTRAFRLLRQCAASLLLLILAIPMLWALVLVFFELGRPIFFTQKRAGLHRRAFSIRKFRTMTNERDAAGVLLPDALRETAITRIMRRTRLDELPQLLAVLQGDMAFIGPRNGCRHG